MAFVAVFAINASAAMANSVGQCNVTPGNTVTSTSEWQSVLRKEGVTKQASKKVFGKAGYHSVDQSLNQWLTQRVIRTKAAKPFSAIDYGCRNKKLFSVGKRSYAKGKGIFAVLPKAYSKKDFSTKKTKVFTLKKTITVITIGLDDCGNPVYGYAKIIIWIVKVKTPPVKPPTTVTPPPPGGECTIIINGDNNGNVGCNSVFVCTANGKYNNNQGLCSAYSNCIAVQGNTWNSTQNVCTTPPPPTCEQTGTCPPPPNRPPVVSIYNPPQHVCSGQLAGGGTTTPGQFTFVIFASDPDGDNLGTPTVSALRGSTGVPTKVADGQWTVRYTAPVTAGTDKVTATVSDGKATASGSTPVFANPLVDLDNPSTTTC